MQLSQVNSRRLLASLLMALAYGSGDTALAQAADANKDAQQAVSTGNTVTHKEPPSAGNPRTAEKMRKAKPFPMPSIKGPPVPQQVTPSPYAEPPGSSPPGFGGPAPR